MTVWKISVSSKVTGSKVELRICKISKSDFEQFGKGEFILFSYDMFWPCMRIILSWDFLFWCIGIPLFHGQERLGSLRMWFDLAPELKFPGNFNSGALSWTLAPELKYPGTFYSGAKNSSGRVNFFGGLQPASQQSQPTSGGRQADLKRGLGGGQPPPTSQRKV